MWLGLKCFSLQLVWQREHKLQKAGSAQSEATCPSCLAVQPGCEAMPAPAAGPQRRPFLLTCRQGPGAGPPASFPHGPGAGCGGPRAWGTAPGSRAAEGSRAAGAPDSLGRAGSGSPEGTGRGRSAALASEPRDSARLEPPWARRAWRPGATSGVQLLLWGVTLSTAGSAPMCALSSTDGNYSHSRLWAEGH